MGTSSIWTTVVDWVERGIIVVVDQKILTEITAGGGRRRRREFNNLNLVIW